MSRPEITPEIINLAWDVGKLSYKLRDSQRVLRQAWLKSKARSKKFLIEATRRLGKSTFALILLVEDALQNPKHANVFFAPVETGLLDYVDPLIRQVIDDAPQELRPRYNASKFSLTFSNGSQILFRGSNNQQHRYRRGNSINLAVIDEARDVDQLSQLIESVVLPSLFSSDGFLILSSTPADSQDHDLWTYREDARVNNWMISLTINDARQYDPKDFPPERIAQFKKETTDPIAWQREYECRWVRDASLTVVPEWDSKKFVGVYEHDKYFEWLHKYLALDVGVNDATSVLLGWYHFPDAKLFIEDEVWLVDGDVTTQRIIEESKKKEAALGYTKMYRRVGDCAAKLTLQDLSKNGLPILPSQKADLLSMVSTLRLWVQNGRILIHPRCKMLIGCLENGIWNKDKTDFGKSKTFRHFDALAALMYLIRHVDVSTNPVPANFGLDMQTRMFDPFKEMNQPKKVQPVAVTPMRKSIRMNGNSFNPMADWFPVERSRTL